MNVIFDLGGVVFNWEPDKLISSVFSNDLQRNKIRKDLYMHQDWIELDRGTLSFAEAAERAESRTGIPSPEVLNMLKQVSKVLTVKEDTLQLIEELYNRNNKLYVLSNMSYEVADYLEKQYSFWNKFDGIVFSARVKLVKPSPKIYKYILLKYNLKPEETVFLDDMKVNVDAASKEGIHGIQFVNAKQANEELKKIKIY